MLHRMRAKIPEPEPSEFWAPKQTNVTNLGRLRRSLSPPLAMGVVSAMVILMGGISAESAGATQAPVPLGTAAPFAVLSSQGISSTANPSPPFVTGDVGVDDLAGTTITGLTTTDVSGTIYAVDSSGPAGSAGNDPGLLSTAAADLGTAYTSAAGASPTNNTNYADITGLTLVPGVYNATSTMNLTGTVTLNGNGVYIFQVGSGLTTSTTSTVALENGAQAGCVFWQVGSSATLAGGTFNGTILALTSISIASTASVTGRLLAENGAVTLVDDTITAPPACSVSAPTTTTTSTTATTATTAPATTTPKKPTPKKPVATKPLAKKAAATAPTKSAPKAVVTPTPKAATVVPVAKTGEPWAGWPYWVLVILVGSVGIAALDRARRRRAPANQKL